MDGVDKLTSARLLHGLCLYAKTICVPFGPLLLLYIISLFPSRNYSALLTLTPTPRLYSSRRRLLFASSLPWLYTAATCSVPRPSWRRAPWPCYFRELCFFGLLYARWIHRQNYSSSTFFENKLNNNQNQQNYSSSTSAPLVMGRKGAVVGLLLLAPACCALLQLAPLLDCCALPKRALPKGCRLLHAKKSGNFPANKREPSNRSEKGFPYLQGYSDFPEITDGTKEASCISELKTKRWLPVTKIEYCHSASHLARIKYSDH